MVPSEAKIEARRALIEKIDALNFLSQRVYRAEVSPDGMLARLLVSSVPKPRTISQLDEKPIWHIMSDSMPIRHTTNLVDTIVRYVNYELETHKLVQELYRKEAEKPTAGYHATSKDGSVEFITGIKGKGMSLFTTDLNELEDHPKRGD